LIALAVDKCCHEARGVRGPVRQKGPPCEAMLLVRQERSQRPNSELDADWLPPEDRRKPKRGKGINYL